MQTKWFKWRHRQLPRFHTLGSHTPLYLHMWANWNSLLCSPVAIPPQALILLNLINYKGGCGWISTPKGNLHRKLALPWEGVCGFSRWHSYLGVSTEGIRSARSHGGCWMSKQAPDLTGFFPQSLQETNGCTLHAVPTLIYVLFKFCSQQMVAFSSQKLPLQFQGDRFSWKGNNSVLYRKMNDSRARMYKLRGFCTLRNRSAIPLEAAISSHIPSADPAPCSKVHVKTPSFSVWNILEFWSGTRKGQ